jgi:hypothetical protein
MRLPSFIKMSCEGLPFVLYRLILSYVDSRPLFIQHHPIRPYQLHILWIHPLLYHTSTSSRYKEDLKLRERSRIFRDHVRDKAMYIGLKRLFSS